MVFKKSQAAIDADTENTIDLIESRGHVYVEGSCDNQKSTLVVWCPKHDFEHTTTFSNYKRSKTGLPCCGKEQVSQKLKDRVFSDETLVKMTEAASKRPYRGGKPRRWRKTSDYAKWRKSVFKNYNNECAITGVKLENSEGKALVAHHLYGAKDYPNLTYVEGNGIVLEESIHMLFHNTYGYTNNTLEQFKKFLSSSLLKETLEKTSMPISSQAKPEGLEGPETRAYDPDRVMKLQERLESLDLKLN